MTNVFFFSNIVGDDDCLKPSLADMKLEPETENHLDMHNAIRKSDKVCIVCLQCFYLKLAPGKYGEHF